jgi:hypothetical protein
MLTRAQLRGGAGSPARISAQEDGNRITETDVCCPLSVTLFRPSFDSPRLHS